ncbi:MAG TPA: 2-oxo acid dehydrogenase subunit E2 [Steroidobacteraceae bacterium]|nr:2-oxo acid dehydrogenase subunit E2 [Steroidobacteraceae bacterium]
MSGGIADVIAPANEEGTKATILRWCKSAGDAIRKDEPLLELETDKVTVEVPSPASGEICEILKQPNEEVEPGQVLARVRIGEAEAQDVTPPPAAAAAERARTTCAEDARELLSPAVRRLLNEHALTAADVEGTGRKGRITREDIQRHLSESAARRKGAGPAQPDALPVGSTRIPHTPIRRRIAEHMVKSLAQAPHVTTLFEADLSRVRAHRAAHAAEYERRGAHLTLTAYFVAACVRALRAHPSVNATFHEDALELHADANIGVGTALGNEGLIVPVIHRAQRLSLAEIAERLNRLVAAARAGKLAPEEVRGGTFTISNHGVGGSLLAAPIVINQPQVAILGVGKVERRVVVVETAGTEAIAIRSMCYLTLSIDHRALDAFQANAFLAHVVKTLEEWSEP